MVLGGVFAWWNWVVGWCALGAVQWIVLRRKGRHRIWLVLPLVACIGMIRTNQVMQPDNLEMALSEDSQMSCVQGTIRWIQPTASMWKIELSDLILDKRKKKQSYGRCILYVKEKPDVQIGNRIQAEGEMELFQQASNPGMYDLRAYYRAQGIRYCLWAEQWQIVHTKTDLLMNAIYQFRTRLVQSLTQAVNQQDAGVMQAVFLGEKSELDADLKQLYQQNGIAHLLAVSGLHISCIGLVVFQLIRRITGKFVCSGIISGIMMAAYIVMTGGSVSALRAGGMFFVLLFANAKGRVYDMPSALSLTVIVILICYPLQLFQCGFQLSVSTVVGIAVIAPAILDGDTHSKWCNTIIVSCSIQLASLPILLWHFFTYPLYSIVLNMIVLPFASVLLCSAAAAAVIGLYKKATAIFFAGSGHFVIRYYQWICQLFETIPGAVQVIGRARWQQVLLYYSCLIAGSFVLEKKAEARRRSEYGIIRQEKERDRLKEWMMAVGMIILIAASLLLLQPIPLLELNITVLDVGQGDCSFISFPDGTTMLIDGGSTSEKEVGTNRIEPFLYSQGIYELDYVVLTHPDEDHINGVTQLLQEHSIQIKTLLLPDVEEGKEQYKEVIRQCENTIWMKKGMMWNNGEVIMHCLHPAQGVQLDDANDWSVVLKLEYKGFSMLFMGDLSFKQEGELESISEVTVLKAGHHGSKNSTSEAFLQQVNPSHVILSYGEQNKYGHPHEETLKRLNKYNCQIWHTAKQGAIQITVKPQYYKISGYIVGSNP
ncbi:MAG: DNA internalization-related competence protein ComEC/Rec2 [Clostridiales bacterium]|nr:DNA internalization-related competence protein ComEC/Rec2 [Clostridiales bacterium]